MGDNLHPKCRKLPHCEHNKVCDQPSHISFLSPMPAATQPAAMAAVATATTSVISLTCSLQLVVPLLLLGCGMRVTTRARGQRKLLLLLAPATALRWCMGVVLHPCGHDLLCLLHPLLVECGCCSWVNACSAISGQQGESNSRNVMP